MSDRATPLYVAGSGVGSNRVDLARGVARNRPRGMPLQASFGKCWGCCLRARARLSPRHVGIALVYHTACDPPTATQTRNWLPRSESEGFRRQLRAPQRHYELVSRRPISPTPWCHDRRGARPTACGHLRRRPQRAIEHMRHRPFKDAGVPATFFLGSFSPPRQRYWWELVQSPATPGLLTSDLMPGGSTRI